MSRHRGGFTFVELLVVVAVLGILASIAIPRISATKDKAKLAALRADIGSAKLAEETYYADYGTYGDFADLQTEGLIRLSPSTTMILGGNAVGYKATATNPTISSSTKSCSVLAGKGIPETLDGVVNCP